MFSFDGNEACEVWAVSVHREKPLADDEDTIEPIAFGVEQSVEGTEIVMCIHTTRCTRQLSADQDAIVNQRVMNDQVLGTKQRREGRNGCCVARDIDDAIFGSIDFGQGMFEIT